MAWERAGGSTLVSHGAPHGSTHEFTETQLPFFDSYAQASACGDGVPKPPVLYASAVCLALRVSAGLGSRSRRPCASSNCSIGRAVPSLEKPSAPTQSALGQKRSVKRSRGDRRGRCHQEPSAEDMTRPNSRFP